MTEGDAPSEKYLNADHKLYAQLALEYGVDVAARFERMHKTWRAKDAARSKENTKQRKREFSDAIKARVAKMEEANKEQGL